MKLKYISINGFGVLVDESAEIEEDVYYLDLNTLTIYVLVSKCNGAPAKILFAEKELNLDVPILPNWREWEVEQSINKLVDDTEHYSHIDDGGDKVFYQGFVKCILKEYHYNHNKAKYTEENLERALREYTMLVLESITAEDSPTPKTLPLPKEFIQSLQKYPQFIIVGNVTDNPAKIVEIIY